MPQYSDPLAAQATALGNQATQAYTAAANARETADKYVRLTVILAAALFLVAIGQRFRLEGAGRGDCHGRGVARLLRDPARHLPRA